MKKTTNKTENTGNNTGKEVFNKHIFKSGEEWRGNANGRPKGSRNLTKIFELSIEEIKIRSKLKGIIIEDPEIEIMLSLLGKAKNGDVRAMELYMKYKYGNPTQPIDFSGEVEFNNSNLVGEFQEMFNKFKIINETTTN